MLQLLGRSEPAGPHPPAWQQGHSNGGNREKVESDSSRKKKDLKNKPKLETAAISGVQTKVYN